MRATLALLFLTAPLAAQTERVDAMTGTRTRRSEWVGLGAGVKLQLARSIDGADTVYALVARYNGERWMFLTGEARILADTTRMTLPGAGSDGPGGSRDVASGRGWARVTELALYVVTPDQLRALARADSLRLRVSGSQRVAERTLSTKDRDRWRAFVAQILPADE